MSKTQSLTKTGSMAKKTVRISGDASPPQIGSPTAARKGRPLSASNGGGNNNRHENDGGIVNFDAMNDFDTRTKEELERMLETRQKSYIERERVWKIRIAELEDELAATREQKTGWMKSDDKIHKLKNMHTEILANVGLVQDRTARILQEQERDLLRAFRARLFDVQAELEKEKNKKDDGAAAWIERNRKLEGEVEWAKEVADRVERVNQTLLQENARLKQQFTSQEEDRQFLIKQLVAVKKDNARLRAEYTELENENNQLKGSNIQLKDRVENLLQTGAPGQSSKQTAAAVQQRLDSEERYKEMNYRLKRLLDEERKSLAQVRQNYANELKIRTEMEMLLRNCVEDVRKEIARRYAEEGQFAAATAISNNDLARVYAKQPHLIPVDDFNQGDRERVLELLLSQERVVSLLYAKTFPINTTGPNGATSTKVNPLADLSAAGGANAMNTNTDMNTLLADDGGVTGELSGAQTNTQTAAVLSSTTAGRLSGNTAMSPAPVGSGGGTGGTRLPSINGASNNRGISR